MIDKSNLPKSKIDPYRLSGNTLLEKYKLEEYVASGGMGAVYRSIQIHTGEQFAIKFLKPDILAKNPVYATLFESEVMAVQQIDHPNIVKIVENGKNDDDVPFMVMEWLEGQSLEDALNQNKFEIEKVYHIFRQVCDAFAYAHSKNILHLDINPANIFIVKSDSEIDFIKVIDFGLSKILSSESGTTVTKFIGTDRYCSPEHYGGKFTFQSDIYSLGLTLYYMLTGLLPIGLSYINAKQYPNLDLPPFPSVLDKCSDLPSTVNDVIQKAIRKKPSERQNSVMQLWEEFSEAVRPTVESEKDTKTLAKIIEKPVLTEGTFLAKLRKLPLPESLLTLGLFVLLISISATFILIKNNSSSNRDDSDIVSNQLDTIYVHKRKIIAIFVETSNNLYENTKNINSIVKNLRYENTLRIYALSGFDIEPTLLTEVYLDGRNLIDKERVIRQISEEVESKLKKFEADSRRSCIMTTLNSAERFFRNYKIDSNDFEIIYLSDMVEKNCKESSGIDFYKDKSIILRKKASNYECRTILPETKITIVNSKLSKRSANSANSSNSMVDAEILPANSIAENLNVDFLEYFWKSVFGHCFNNKDFLNSTDNFYFDQVLPQRFR
jgi:serine/threonine protein kinase